MMTFFERGILSPRCLFFVSLVALWGCGQGLDSEIAYESEQALLIHFSADTLATYALDGRLLSSSDSLSTPLHIATAGDYLYVGDNKATRRLTLFDRHTGEFLKATGGKGKGPREIDYLWTMDFKPGSGSGWLFDFSSRTIHYFDGDSLTGKSIRLQNMGQPMGPVWIKGDSIASVGLYEDGRLGLYGSDGLFGRFIGAPPPGDAEVPIPVRQHAYEAATQTNSDGSRIVVVSQNTDLIEIFSTESLVYTVLGPGFNVPMYTLHGDDEGHRWLVLNDETIKSYTDVDATDDLVFALYSGQTFKDFKNSTWQMPPSQTVFVFSWSGMPIAKLEIEDGALAISVSDDGHDLYAIYHRPVPMIMHYDLPTHLLR